ncbi:hypothetical protein [Acidimangrovimonas pyrenivorans]|uniref:Uncharacterized protein n=1 Tax=Acidimangrovimonas pyrenivorans TaxID=2030798 RepID=A0ABV7AIV3_9RHOB
MRTPLHASTYSQSTGIERLSTVQFRQLDEILPGLPESIRRLPFRARRQEEQASLLRIGFQVAVLHREAHRGHEKPVQGGGACGIASTGAFLGTVAKQ